MSDKEQLYYIMVKNSGSIKLLYAIHQVQRDYILSMKISNIVKSMNMLMREHDTNITIYNYDNKNINEFIDFTGLSDRNNVVFHWDICELFQIAINLDFGSNYCECYQDCNGINKHQSNCINCKSNISLSQTPNIIWMNIKNIDIFPQDLIDIILTYFVT